MYTIRATDVVEHRFRQVPRGKHREARKIGRKKEKEKEEEKEEKEKKEEWKKDTLGSIKIERIGGSSKGENDVTDLTTRKKGRDKKGGGREGDTHTRNSGIRDSVIVVEDEMRKIVTKYLTTVANARDTSTHDVVYLKRTTNTRSASTPTRILPRSRVPKKLNTLVRDSRRRRLHNGGSRLRTRVSNDVYDNGRTRFTPAPTFPCKISMRAKLRTISRWYGFPWRQCQSASQRRVKSRWKGRSHRVKDSKVDGPTRVLRGT
ncbi:hypothetical protein V1478_012994 [Vespula squamosa]|uniref:Uncharacterized protein n=1 Tax=Vespula squamosa TaxID=30214 RepID=A0ABD2A9J8_VESSQ